MRASVVHEIRAKAASTGNQSSNENQNYNSQEMIANLAGGIAHQFNNALVGITGSIELLKMDMSDGEKIDCHFDRIEASVERMTSLTNQLLAYAQGGKYHPRKISLNHLIDETLFQIRRNFHHHIMIETDLQKSIERVVVDENQLKMVISALVINAAEAISENGRIKIKTESELVCLHDNGAEKQSLVHLFVEDNGQGMNESVRQRVFEPFFSTKMKGRGLGMAAVHGIVLNHGGRIRVDSEVDAGTKIQVTLPGIIEDHIEEIQKDGSKPSGISQTVLIIEDEEMVMDVLLAFLKKYGYRVLIAKTGQEAINIAEMHRNQIDLALLDIELPDMGGNIVYQYLLKACPDIKVVVCSGYSVGGPVQEVLESGAQGFIQKPFSHSSLSQTLKEIIKENPPSRVSA